ncbi:DUF1272 domain-containing protein [Persicobacter psychrovividus]|uniref:DUF1272 domain-containing protein n=1 Tax=Persicobacter psychrovividus TaxID=387638 RepID=A0ABN6LDE2_9BACT|nr:hypothetical protein PEPS_19480 [Persicobacter psychrovividus]
MEIRPNCENCNKPLPYDSEEAMICTFDCTFCADCVTGILEDVCPNCGGNFERRPIRPKSLLKKYPISKKAVLNPIKKATFEEKKRQLKPIAPADR